jgi:leucyl/phenylalanyl-tRNA--protein transferase
MRLSPDLLLDVYSRGVFPMAASRDDDKLLWMDPKRRGILPLERFHISRSLAKQIHRAHYRISFNTDFSQILQCCAARDETWINGEISTAFKQLHVLGRAHSVEVWAGNELIGGAYGLAIGGVFCGESMFSIRRDASKIALAYLTDRLVQCGFKLYDTQFLTPHLESLGGIEISQAAYRALLKQNLFVVAKFDSQTAVPSPQLLLHRKTQIS